MKPAREPGEPVPKDEIDPELVSLRPRTQVGLITALSVVVFCVFLGFKLWPDFQFAGEGRPRAVTVDDIAEGKVADEAHVHVEVALERGAAVRVRRVRGVPGLRVVPAAGGADRVWVVLDGNGWTKAREAGAYTGRLRRLSELPIASSFRGHVREHPAPRYIAAEELRRARGAGATELTAVTGDRFTVADDDIVEIVVNDPDEVHVVASLDSFRKDAAAWAKALADAGLVQPGAEPVATEGQQVTFVVSQPGALAQTDAKLVEARLYGAKVVPIVRRNQHTWKELEGAALPASFQVAAVHASRPLPGDPWVVIVGESPDHYWYVRPLYVLLVVFAALFAWALVRTARVELTGPRAPPHHV